MSKKNLSCPLIAKRIPCRLNIDGVLATSTEYIVEDLDERLCQPELIRACCAKLIPEINKRNSVVIFVPSVKTAQQFESVLRKHYHMPCAHIDNTMSTDARSLVIQRFARSAELELFAPKLIRCLVSAFPITNTPAVDCVVLFRPTMDSRVHYMMLQDAATAHPLKHNCLVLDFTDNITRFGLPLNIKPKLCTKCFRFGDSSMTICPDCGGLLGIISSKPLVATHLVKSVKYAVHRKHHGDDNTPRSMRVDYCLNDGAILSEWVCIEHHGYAKEKAIHWWRQRASEPMPKNVEEAVAIASSVLACPVSITVRYAEKALPEILDAQFGNHNKSKHEHRTTS